MALMMLRDVVADPSDILIAELKMDGTSSLPNDLLVNRACDVPFVQRFRNRYLGDPSKGAGTARASSWP